MRAARIVVCLLGVGSAAVLFASTPSEPGVRLLPMDSLAPANVSSLPPGVTADPLLKTYKVNLENRPARLVQGPQRLARRLAVPPGGARFETAISPAQHAVTLRVSMPDVGAPLATVTALPGRWTPVIAELPSRDDGRSEIELIEELDAARDTYVVWSDDRLLPSVPQADRPDVLLISLDTVRADYLTPYSRREMTTPALAQLAQEGIRFDQAISVSSWTMPAHAAIFTGRYPNLELGFSQRFDAAELTLAEIFSATGYNPDGASGGPYTDSDFGFQQGFRSYLDSRDWKNADALTNWAIDRITSSTRGTPLFLFLNYFDVHDPNTGITPQEWQAAFGKKLDAADPLIGRIREGYRRDLRTVDRAIGRLFDAIRTHRDWNNTIVIAFSDHGQLLGERGFVGHALSLDEELIRVPLIVKPAGARRPARPVYREQFQLTDAFPLLLELAGIDTAEPTPLLPRILGGKPVRDLTFAQVRHQPTPELKALPRWQSATVSAVRTDSTKVVRDEEGRVTTYRVGAGPEVAVARGSVAERLLGELDLFQRTRATPAVAAAPLVLRSELLDRLRALGYIR